MYKNKRISVAIATYNGEDFIEDMLRSVLAEKKIDEIIISDDSSGDNTRTIIDRISDSRVKIITGPTKGLIKNFENALKNTSGDIIFLADQDDVWIPNRVENMCSALESNDLVCADCHVTDENLNITSASFFRLNDSRSGLIRNIYKNSYLGCCMAFRRNVLLQSIPFPNNIAMHDWWIGIVGELFFKTYFLKTSTLLFRRHSKNNSNTSKRSPYSLGKKLSWRINLVKNLIKKYFEL